MNILNESSYRKTSRISMFQDLSSILFDPNDFIDPRIAHDILKRRRNFPKSVRLNENSPEEIKKNMREFIKTINIEKATIETYLLMNDTDISNEETENFRKLYLKDRNDFFVEYVIFIFRKALKNGVIQNWNVDFSH